MKAATFTALLFACLPGMSPATAVAQPYIISADGSEVVDQKTGLIWRRCAEGMGWNGSTCSGSASTFTHRAAVQRAAAQAASTGVAWRLPDVKQLSSIADKIRHNPAIDPAAFPATPSNWFWSSSLYAGNSSHAWSVFFSDGRANFSDGVNSYHVRLVRAAP